MRKHAAPILFIATLLWATASAVRLPSFLQRKKYTPLLFFTLPKDESPECDAMEVAVKEVERDLGVKVERLDLLKTPESQALLGILGNMPPLLYNRESCQVYQLPAPKGKQAANKARPSIDREQVRAWAKGRQVRITKASRATSANSGSSSQSSGGGGPIMVSKDEDAAMDQEELLNELQMTPLQRQGKRAIQERAKQAEKSK